MNIAELSRIDRAIEIRAPLERVWRALTDARELSTWFQVKIEGAITAGGEVWMESVHPQHLGMRWPVRIVELTRPTRVVWQWHPGEKNPATDDPQEAQTTVTFTLEPTPEGTRVSVSETGFENISLARRAKAYADNSQGWTEVLVWLQKHVEASR